MKPRAAELGVPLSDALRRRPADRAGRSGGIHRALLNIVGNALDAVEGRPEATFTVGRQRSERSDWVPHRVVDNGVGIPPDKLDDIFKPFVSTKGGQRHGPGPGRQPQDPPRARRRHRRQSQAGCGQQVHAAAARQEPARKQLRTALRGPGSGLTALQFTRFVPTLPVYSPPTNKDRTSGIPSALPDPDNEVASWRIGMSRSIPKTVRSWLIRSAVLSVGLLAGVALADSEGPAGKRLATRPPGPQHALEPSAVRQIESWRQRPQRRRLSDRPVAIVRRRRSSGRSAAIRRRHPRSEKRNLRADVGRGIGPIDAASGDGPAAVGIAQHRPCRRRRRFRRRRPLCRIVCRSRPPGLRLPYRSSE